MCFCVALVHNYYPKLIQDCLGTLWAQIGGGTRDQGRLNTGVLSLTC